MDQEKRKAGHTHISNFVIFIDNCKPLKYKEEGIHVVGCSFIHKRRVIPGIQGKNFEFFCSKIKRL